LGFTAWVVVGPAQLRATTGVAAGAADAFQCPPPPDAPCGVRGGGTPGDAWTAAEVRGAGRVRAEACCTGRGWEERITR
jgi:hypothetical protein